MKYAELFFETNETSVILKDDFPILEQLLDYLILNPSTFFDSKKFSRTTAYPQNKIFKLINFLENQNIGQCIYPFKNPHLNLEIIPYFKFYFLDYAKVLNFSKLSLRRDQEGAKLEQEFIEKVIGLNLFKISTFRLTYENEDIEVDFILESNTSFFAIEIKKDQFIYASDLFGLHFFDKHFPLEKDLFVLHHGQRDNKEGKINILPIEKGLNLLTNFRN